MIKAQFNDQNFVIGYFPDEINYPNNIIDAEAKTIDGLPYVEITEEQHQVGANKQMCVINGIYQEYVTPDSILLEQGKIMKIGQCLQYLSDTDWYVIRMSDLSNASEIPQNILTNRTNARTWQKDIKDAMTLEELNNININFD